MEKAAQLREIWHGKCIEAGGTARVDVLSWMSKAALDAIGKAGFDYELGNLNENENGAKTEMAAALEGVFRTDATALEQARALLDDYFPLLRAISPGKTTRASNLSKKRMDEIGMQIVQEKKQAVLDRMGAGPIGKKAVGGKDLISLLLQANLAADLTPSQRLTDREVLAQIPTFIVAGHETTSNSITWAMHSLALHPEKQNTLRHELLQVGTKSPTLDVLNALPYLDHVVRETLRLYSVVAFITREVTADDVIPLSAPTKDIHGNTLNSIRVQRGDQIQVPLYLINRSKTFFGADADEFRPERWDNPLAEAAAIPGVIPNLMSFSGGPRSCVGHRFAVAEMKAFLFHIIRGFEFRLAVDPQDLWSRTGVVTRPQLRSDNSIQLPVCLTPIA